MTGSPLVIEQESTDSGSRASGGQPKWPETAGPSKPTASHLDLNVTPPEEQCATDKERGDQVADQVNGGGQVEYRPPDDGEDGKNGTAPKDGQADGLRWPSREPVADAFWKLVGDLDYRGQRTAHAMLLHKESRPG
jgi:hypothetical protein